MVALGRRAVSYERGAHVTCGSFLERGTRVKPFVPPSKGAALALPVQGYLAHKERPTP